MTETILYGIWAEVGWHPAHWYAIDKADLPSAEEQQERDKILAGEGDPSRWTPYSSVLWFGEGEPRALATLGSSSLAWRPGISDELDEVFSDCIPLAIATDQPEWFVPWMPATEALSNSRPSNGHLELLDEVKVSGQTLLAKYVGDLGWGSALVHVSTDKPKLADTGALFVPLWSSTGSKQWSKSWVAAAKNVLSGDALPRHLAIVNGHPPASVDNAQIDTTTYDAATPREQTVDDLVEDVRVRVECGYQSDVEIVERFATRANALGADIAQIVDAASEQHRKLENEWDGPTDCDRLDAALDELERSGWVTSRFTYEPDYSNVDLARKTGSEARAFVWFGEQNVEDVRGGEELRLVLGCESLPWQLCSSELDAEVTAALAEAGLSGTTSPSAKPGVVAVDLKWRRRRPA